MPVIIVIAWGGQSMGGGGGGGTWQVSVLDAAPGISIIEMSRQETDQRNRQRRGHGTRRGEGGGGVKFTL